MLLYSRAGAMPEPLPFRITLPNGFTRTDPATFTPEEIASAGFVGPIPLPACYDPVLHDLAWDGQALTATPKPPPPLPPDWPRFKATLLADGPANEALAAAFPTAPGAVLALPAALFQAVRGDLADFRAAWALLTKHGLVPESVLAAVQALAVECRLPEQFVAALAPECAPGDSATGVAV